MTKAFKAVRGITKAVKSPNASDELISWLDEKPQTYGWGAILAYDRQKANKMLKQEYLSRFNSDSILLPFSLNVEGGAETKKLNGYEFDAPLMSFENYTDDDINDEPRCVLRLPIIAGSYMTVAAKGIVTSISVLDPLDGQVLTMRMDLKTGLVNQKNQVMFNIQEGTDFSVDVNNNALDQLDVGKVIKAFFVEQVPDDKKVWALSQIDTSKNQYLKPAIVKLEARKREGTAEIADGELIICVGMAGDPAGTTLPADYKYLTGVNSAVIILGQKTLLDKVVRQQILKFHSLAQTQLVETGDTTRLDVISGSRDSQAKHYTYKSESADVILPVTLSYQVLNFASAGNDIGLRVDVSAGALRCLWQGSNVVSATAGFGDQWGSNWEGTIDQSWLGCATVGYKVKEDGSGLVASGVVSTPVNWSRDIICTNIPAATKSFSNVFNNLCLPYKNEYLPELNDTVMTETFNNISELPELNTFVLESILFKNEDTVSLSSCAMPNDLVMFGDVGPTSKAFEITPMEAVILQGKAQQFTLVPAGADGVTWSVESASGAHDFIGNIDTHTGLYTASDLSGYQGNQVRVRIIATYANYQTYALVSVLKKTITVNPLATVKIIGEEPSDRDKVTLSANSADGIAPTWRLKVTGNQGTLASTTGFTNVYTPRPYDEVEADYVVDEIILTDSAGTEHSAVVVVNHAVRVSSAMTEGSSTETTVQLQCKVGKDDLTTSTTFNVLLDGSGTISDTGLYTQGQEGTHPFALVNCSTSYFGVDAISYILIPLPLSVSHSL
jgi:hypothetical protein